MQCFSLPPWIHNCKYKLTSELNAEAKNVTCRLQKFWQVHYNFIYEARGNAIHRSYDTTKFSNWVLKKLPGRSLHKLNPSCPSCIKMPFDDDSSERKCFHPSCALIWFCQITRRWGGVVPAAQPGQQLLDNINCAAKPCFIILHVHIILNYLSDYLPVFPWVPSQKSSASPLYLNGVRWYASIFLPQYPSILYYWHEVNLKQSSF